MLNYYKGDFYMIIEFKALNKYFNEFHVLKDINFTIESGKTFGYLGRNGAGKTTSIRILMDVFPATNGGIFIDGKPFDPKDYKIGYLPEERGMYSKSTVKDQLIYFAMLRGASKEEALESVLYWTKRFEVDVYLDRLVETLSKGNQQKVQITQAFLNEPDILILDEPFSGLDPVNSQVFQTALKEYINDDRFIIFSSHQMSYVESFCNDIAIINHGEIVLKGNLTEIKDSKGQGMVRINASNPELLEAQLADTDYKKDSQGFILTLLDSKENFLSNLFKAGVDITLFENYQPTLQDIFIEVAGDEK